jgi:hypothetical protein
VLALAWAFILAVAVYDLHFAWSYRAAFEGWDLNPLARHVGQHYGAAAVSWA